MARVAASSGKDRILSTNSSPNCDLQCFIVASAIWQDKSSISVMSQSYLQ